MVVVYSHSVAAFREYLLLGALLRPSTFELFENDVFSSGFGGRGIAFIEYPFPPGKVTQ